MNRTALVLLLFAFTFAGCTHTRTVDLSGNDGVTASEFNQTAVGKPATIVLKDGRTIHGSNVQMATDFLSYYSPETGQFESVPTSQVQEATVLRIGRGALVGVGAGVVGGAVLGFARALTMGDDVPSGASWTREQKLVGFPITHALIGALVGAPTGAALGVKEHFEFLPGAVAPSQLDRPVAAASPEKATK